VAIGLLALGANFPRHRGGELVVAYVGINAGLLAVSASLASSTVTDGLGLGAMAIALAAYPSTGPRWPDRAPAPRRGRNAAASPPLRDNVILIREGLLELSGKRCSF